MTKYVECGLSQNADPVFLASQNILTIFLKDGYSFFKAHAETLTRRFSDQTKQTNIIIVHPDTPHMDAVASMDDNKKGHPESQRSDCLQAVKILQDIRNNLLSSGLDDCVTRVNFVGQDNVPTWNGTLGDDVGLIQLYPSRPHRGQQVRLTAQRGELPYTFAADDIAFVLKENAVSHNLWNYSQAHIN